MPAVLALCARCFKDRFLGFTDVRTNCTATAFFDLVSGTLREYKSEGNLVVQTYDGAAVVAGGLNIRMEEQFPCAVFLKSFIELNPTEICYNVRNTQYFSDSAGTSCFLQSSKRIQNCTSGYIPLAVRCTSRVMWQGLRLDRL